jgi:hypothetical protein
VRRCVYRQANKPVYVALSDKKASFRCSSEITTGIKHGLGNRFGIVYDPCVFAFEEGVEGEEVQAEEGRFVGRRPCPTGTPSRFRARIGVEIITVIGRAIGRAKEQHHRIAIRLARVN